MIEGFLLGLATGVTCLAYCAPVLTPFLLGEGRSTRQNWAILGQFLGGRLCGYLLFGLFAWAGGRGMAGLLEAVGGDVGYRSLLFGVIYVVLAALLLVYGLSGWKTESPSCAGARPSAQGWLARWPALAPAGLGLLTGLNLCPPFLLALTGAAASGSLLSSLLFFLAFFGGTSLYMLPLPFLGVFHRIAALRMVGKWAAVLVALYYLYSGIVLIVVRNA